MIKNIFRSFMPLRKPTRKEFAERLGDMIVTMDTKDCEYMCPGTKNFVINAIPNHRLGWFRYFRNKSNMNWCATCMDFMKIPEYSKKLFIDNIGIHRKCPCFYYKSIEMDAIEVAVQFLEEYDEE